MEKKHPSTDPRPGPPLYPDRFGRPVYYTEYYSGTFRAVYRPYRLPQTFAAENNEIARRVGRAKVQNTQNVISPAKPPKIRFVATSFYFILIPFSNVFFKPTRAHTSYHCRCFLRSFISLPSSRPFASPSFSIPPYIYYLILQYRSTHTRRN